MKGRTSIWAAAVVGGVLGLLRLLIGHGRVLSLGNSHSPCPCLVVIKQNLILKNCCAYSSYHAECVCVMQVREIRGESSHVLVPSPVQIACSRSELGEVGISAP